MYLRLPTKACTDINLTTLYVQWPLDLTSMKGQNQRKLTLQKPRKIWDQTNHVIKSEMTLNRVTKRQYSTVKGKDRNKKKMPIQGKGRTEI